uniref:C2 DOCK-type domain-containing protein n=2 Tax=Mesocestoides corti TaxID=53468 RepID=A0A5K3EHC2_MESCO
MGNTTRNPDLILTDAKETYSSSPSKSQKSGSYLRQSGLLTPFAWTAVDLSNAVSHFQDFQVSPRRRHTSACERLQSTDHKEVQSQRMLEVFRRPRLFSESGDLLRRPSRNRTISNDRLADFHHPEKPHESTHTRECDEKQPNSNSSEESLAGWTSNSSSYDSQDDPPKIGLNLCLTTRTFIKKDLTVGNHTFEIERTLLEVFKLKSVSGASVASQNPWVHDVPPQLSHGHPLRRIKTMTGQAELTISGQIVAPWELARRLKNTTIYSAEGDHLRTGESEILMQEVLEFPTPRRIFPFNRPRNLLYIYPQSVSFIGSKPSSKNIKIAVQLRHENSTGCRLIPAFPVGIVTDRFRTEACTHVIFKNKSPEYVDEIKVVLPPNLDSNHYLLFTFINVTISSHEMTESVLGYSWLPLLSDGRICAGDDTLYVTHNSPTLQMTQTKPSVSEFPSGNQKETIRIFDPSKTAFRVRVVPVSSLYQGDAPTRSIVEVCASANLAETIKLMGERDIFSEQPELNPQSPTPPLLAHIAHTELSYLVLHFGPIMDGLLQALGTSLLQGGGMSAQNLINLLSLYVHRISTGLSDWNERGTGRNHLMCAYLSGIGGRSTEDAVPYLLSGFPMFGLSWIDDVYENIPTSNDQPPKKLHEELLLCLLSQVITKTVFYKHFHEDTFWFFLELLIRTLLVECKGDEDAATQRFLEDLVQFTQEVAKQLSQHIQSSANEEAFEKATGINRALSFFIQDLFGCLNAFDVYRLIVTYLREVDSAIGDLLTPTNASDGLMTMSRAMKVHNLELLKLGLLQVASATPLYSAINVPDPLLLPANVHPINQALYFDQPSRDTDILRDPTYQRLHFLPAVLLGEAKACLQHSDRILQETALGAIWCLMKTHESESRVTAGEKQGILRDVSAVYIPLLDLACDHAPSLYASWIHAMQREEEVGLDIEKLSSASEMHRSISGTLKRPSRILSSVNPKERVKKIVRRSSCTPDRAALGTKYSPGPPRDRLRSLAVANKWVLSVLPQTDSFFKPSGSESEKTGKFDDSIVQLLLLEVLWVLHHALDEVLQRWLVRGGIQKTQNLVVLLILSFHYFEFTKDTVHQGDEYTMKSASDAPNECPSDTRALEDVTVTEFTRSGDVTWQNIDKTVKKDGEKAKRLFLMVTSIVCRTFKLIVNAFDQTAPVDQMQDSKTEEVYSKLIASNTINNIFAAYIFGLSTHQCVKTFRLLCYGVCELISRFPNYFFNDAPVTSFALCRVLLPYCSSPLLKLRNIANAVIFCLFQQNHIIHKHFYQLNCQMTLALHMHIFPNEPFFDPSFSWLSKRLDAIGRCLSDVSESNPKHQWTSLLPPLLHEVEGASEFPTRPPNAPPDARTVLMRTLLPEFFRELKDYANKEAAEETVEVTDSEPRPVLNGFRETLKQINCRVAEASFKTQIDALVDMWQVRRNRWLHVPLYKFFVKDKCATLFFHCSI